MGLCAAPTPLDTDDLVAVRLFCEPLPGCPDNVVVWAWLIRGRGSGAHVRDNGRPIGRSRSIGKRSNGEEQLGTVSKRERSDCRRNAVRWVAKRPGLVSSLKCDSHRFPGTGRSLSNEHSHWWEGPMKLVRGARYRNDRLVSIDRGTVLVKPLQRIRVGINKGAK